MIVLFCLGCNSIHQQQECPHCHGTKHLLLFDFEVPVKADVMNVVDTFEKVACCDSCSICMDHMVDAIKLPCRHKFHENCIKSWFGEKQQDCPLCRRSILRYEREMDGNQGFLVKPYTEEALEELERVEKLHRRSDKYRIFNK